MIRTCATTWVMAMLAAPTLVMAQEIRSVDLALPPLRTTCRRLSDLDAVDGSRQPWCAVASVQALHQPLVVKSSRGDVDPLITWQAHARLGGALQRGPLLVGATVPVTWQLEADRSPSPAPGGLASGLGDVAVNSSLDLYVRPGVALVLNADVRVPTSVRDAWLGERGVRGLLGATVSSTQGRHGLHGALSVEGPRRNLGPSLGGPRLFGAAAWRWQAGDHVQTQLGTVFRANTLTRADVASLPVELRAGARVQGPRVDVDISVNRAIFRGIGSARIGLQIGATWHPVDEQPVDEPSELRVRPDRDVDTGEFNRPRVVSHAPPPDPTRVVEDDNIADLLAPEPEPEPEPEPPREQAALPSLLIDTLFFEVGRTDLIPASRSTLQALIEQLLAQPEVGPVLLEGHASEEGSLAYNYELSLRRCDAVYRALLTAGISPARLVLRPFGEAVQTPGRAVTAQRRVEVRLILGPDQVAPDINPLTGERVTP